MDFFGKYKLDLENEEKGTYFKIWKFMYKLD